MKDMTFSLVYLLNRLWLRVFEFLRHWYINGFLKTMYLTYDLLEYFDQFFALKITVRKWLEPIYQDYTFIGHILGFTLRTARIFVALVFYIVLLALIAVLFILWAAFPLFVIYQIIVNL